jgi:alkyl hydroperoxide reductase subunit AhpF
MALLDEKIRKQVTAALAGIAKPVRMVMFTQGEGGALECENCGQTRELVEEVASLSDKLSVDVRDFTADEALARQYGVDKIPAVVLLSDGDPPTDHGIRIYGVPAGYEFSSLIEDLRMLGSGEPGLSTETMAALQTLTGPVHIQVFVTPT